MYDISQSGNRIIMASKYNARMRESQAKYRKKKQKQNERNAAIVAYVKEHFPWVIEAFEIKKQVITTIDFFLFILCVQMFFSLVHHSKQSSCSNQSGKP